MDNADELLPLCGACTLRVFTPYIECAQCVNVNVCVECFSKGVQFLGHRNDHPYYVHRLEFAPLEPSWTALEEHRLLTAVERHGYANWTDVAKSLPERTPQQCADHYRRCYVDESRHPLLPPLTTWSVLRSDPPYLRTCSGDHVAEEAAGYNAHRSDFEFNYDNHAERLLDFAHDDDDEEDNELTDSLKCAVVTAYNNRLRERQRRYKIIREHGLVQLRTFGGWWQQYEEVLGKSVCDALTTFMQLLTGVQFDALVEGLARERDVRKRLFKLCEARKNGIATFGSYRLYETLKRRRDEHARQMRALHSSTKDLDWSLEPPPKSSHEGKKKPAAPLEIAGMDDYERLDDRQKEFCSSVRLAPSSFIKFRDLLIAENDKGGFLRLCDARRLIKIDVNKTRKLYDMLLADGFIKKPL